MDYGRGGFCGLARGGGQPGEMIVPGIWHSSVTAKVPTLLV